MFIIYIVCVLMSPKTIDRVAVIGFYVTLKKTNELRNNCRIRIKI